MAPAGAAQTEVAGSLSVVVGQGGGMRHPTSDGHDAAVDVVRIGVAGDWHGNRRWALRCVEAMAEAGVGELYQLGDFGIWPGPSGRTYLAELEAALAPHAMTLFVTPGNHEDYDQINEVSAVDRGHDIGAVQWITEHIALLPRGHRWQRNGWAMLSLGGAPSLDRWSRRKGVDWWDAEMITDEDLARVVESGPADVMLTHDAPDARFSTPAVAAILRSNPVGWPSRALRYAAKGKARMTTAFLAVQPTLFLHGHFHVKDEAWVEHFQHPTRVVSLHCDGEPEGNLVVVALPVRASGEQPGVEWVPVAAAARHPEVPGDGVASPRTRRPSW